MSEKRQKHFFHIKNEIETETLILLEELINIPLSKHELFKTINVTSHTDSVKWCFFSQMKYIPLY